MRFLILPLAFALAVAVAVSIFIYSTVQTVNGVFEQARQEIERQTK